MPNEHLVEADLAQSLGVTRAAVRTALVRLAQENLVERLPNRGARVRRISEKEAVELHEARLILECFVARRAAANATDDDVRALHAIVDEMERSIGGDELAYTQTNTRLHSEILRIADHATTAHLLESIRTRSANFHFRSVLNPNNPRSRLEEHRAIVKAIEERDPDKAESAMHTHLSGVATRMRARLEERRGAGQ